MRNGKIGVTTENIFPVIKKFLYSDHEIFLRELVSNAVDATQKLKTLSSKGEAEGELGDMTIHVAVDGIISFFFMAAFLTVVVKCVSSKPTQGE